MDSGVNPEVARGYPNGFAMRSTHFDQAIPLLELAKDGGQQRPNRSRFAQFPIRNQTTCGPGRPRRTHSAKSSFLVTWTAPFAWA